jgi:hypothetical protein
MVKRVRDRLLGHHCGVTAEEASALLARTGSLINAEIDDGVADRYVVARNHVLGRHLVDDDTESTRTITNLMLQGPARPS